MEPTEDTEDAVERKYNELCLDLNMDKRTKEESWENYQNIKTKYTLEGDQMHWLACALYEACRRSVTPTVGRGTMEGNGVSLTRLLRSAKFSLIQFFNKMKKWSDMAGLPQEFIDKVNKLERNFAVSTVIFKKFEPIFRDIFQHPVESQHNKQNRNKKQRRMPCTSNEVFNFCWTMYVQVKGHFPAISDDLVNSYHLLLCCLDWFYANALMGGRKDLLNPSFEGLPEDFANKDWKPPFECPCIIKLLCDKHEGLEIEARVIKEHWWKPHIKKLFDKKILKGKPETLSAVLEVGNFDANKKSISEAYEEYPLNYSSKCINNEYEAYVLSVGDFDERVFLGSEADEEIGTPTKYREEGTGELAERLQANLQQHFDETRSLAPSTPLTGRRYLKEKDVSTTPVSTATQSVGKLQSLLVGRKALPSDDLLDIFSEIGTDPKTRIMERVDEMGEIFCNHYVQETEDHAGSQIEFAQKRLQLGECLYYKMVESILFNERKRMDNKEGKAALATLMEQDIFHRTLFACCLEIVIFSYNSQRSFPWIVEIFNLSPYHFYKVIEIIIRTEEGLSRDVVKHLNHIEESILESLAWRSGSPLWDAIKESSVPGCEDVVLPNDHDGMKTSPVKHPAVIRVTETQPQQPRKDPLMSPPAGVSAADRFSSPSPGSAKRRLFSVLTQPPETPVSSENTPTENSTTSVAKTTQIIAFQQAQTNDGRQILIPVHTIIHSGTKDDKKDPAKNRPKKTGSLALFFRKLYHLASVRLRDLCEQLYIDDIDLRRKMWTCFEYVLVNHVELMMDRHIDQIIMCAIYVMAKVSDHPQSFTDIMRCYRLQPQAESHVYRSVLLKCRSRRKSGESDSSKNGTSGQSSPVNVENTDKKRSEKLSTMRSSSTLPTPHPGSHPPTPTILIQSASGGEEGEERGDLIMFYNRVFVEKVKKFAQKFSAQKNSKDCPPLSPLPVVKSQSASPRRVSSKHPIYLSPHKPTLHATPMATGLSYSFQKSPAKDLRAINNMIKMKDFREGKKILGKRQLDVHMEEEDGPQTKQLCTGFSFLKRLQNVSSDRQEASVLKLD
ncbi:retinoblastoma-like protein 1 isoform X1 [Saccostrea echinata]|uniref:retinoblastoma-like protein 1 isoform X1 n=1 Tax=Saccostrea echinata TaxID=191078 RepID=UPI002A802636|nr:retinoblastoma-like protein 1 isoform X1 [Saccostrea echinata]